MQISSFVLTTSENILEGFRSNAISKGTWNVDWIPNCHLILTPDWKLLATGHLTMPVSIEVFNDLMADFQVVKRFPNGISTPKGRIGRIKDYDPWDPNLGLNPPHWVTFPNH
eukprot:Platyproteum_vivax@DN396_c0_g1_i1.p1